MMTKLRPHLLAYLFFLAVAVLITWPLLTVFSTHFAGYPFGDSHEMTRHIWWFKYALQHGQPLIFQPLLGYPDGMQGVILWSDPLQFFPAWLFAFIMPLPAAYNLQCLLNLALNGWAACFLMSRLTEGERFPALVAGVVFMAAPVMQGHLAGGHGGLLVQWPLPLFACSLLHLRQNPPTVTPPILATGNWQLLTRLSPGTQHVARSTLFFLLLAFGHTLQLIYAGLPLIGVFALTLLVKREWRALGRVLLVILIGGALLLLFLSPILDATLDSAAYAEEGGAVAFSIDLLGIITPSFNHPLYGQLEYTRRVLGVNLVEGSSYVGIVAGLLALIAVWKVRAARWWLLLAAVAWILALGPLLKVFDAPLNLRTSEFSTYITLPWALVADWPLFDLARTPGRFGFVLALAIAVLAGYGLSWALSQAESRLVGARHAVPLFIPHTSYLIPFLLIAAILFDYQSYWPLPTYSATIPPAIVDLAARDEVRAVYNIPWDNVLAAKDALWLQTAHEKPMIAGQVTRRTPVSPAKLTILQQSLNPALLDEAGVDVIILHKHYDGAGTLAALAREKLGTPYYEDESLALWDVPDTDQPSLFIAAITSVEELRDQADNYFYVPEKGWLRFVVQLDGDAEIVFQLNGEQLTRHTVRESRRLMLDLPIDTPGYQTLTMLVDPPCFAMPDPLLECPALTLSDRGAALSPFDPTAIQAVFDRGVKLNGLLTNHTAGNYTLWWQFDQPRTEQDVRFIKILDERGNQVAGSDETLGSHPAGSQWVETLELSPPAEFAPGKYRVCVGWYTYPDLTRFAVLSDVEGAQDGLACVGEFTIPSS